MGQSLKTWQTTTPEATRELAARIARACPNPSETLSVIYLQGDLGAGKTTFAQGFVRGCGISEPVRSPTYALLEAYEGAGVTVVHLDLYRLRDAQELESLGLRDFAKSAHLWLIEWPERGGGHLPSPDLDIRFQLTDAAHEIAASASSDLGHAWLTRLA